MISTMARSCSGPEPRTTRISGSPIFPTPSSTAQFIRIPALISSTPPGTAGSCRMSRYRIRAATAYGTTISAMVVAPKKLTSAIDEFRLNKELFSGNTLTLGVYAAHYTMNDNWSLGSNILTTNVPNAAPIILSATAGGNIYQVTSPQGITTNGGYNILQNGRATNVAAYLSDSWKIDRWLFDAGARLEHINLTQETSNYHKVQ